MKRLLLLGLFVAAPAFADKLTFNVVGIDCASCAPPVKKALASVAGVTNVVSNVPSRLTS